MINIPVPSGFETFVRDAVSSGRYEDPAAVLAEALRLLQRREQLLTAVRAGVEQLDRGEYSEYGVDSLDDFLRDVAAEERTKFGKENP
jgi:putative addiction module CopG family antidote